METLPNNQDMNNLISHFQQQYLHDNIQNLDTQNLHFPLNVTPVLLTFLLMLICQNTLNCQGAGLKKIPNGTYNLGIP